MACMLGAGVCRMSSCLLGRLDIWDESALPCALQAGVPDEGLTPELAARRGEEREFLEQLVDNSKVRDRRYAHS
jgi:hypothetical protein